MMVVGKEVDRYYWDKYDDSRTYRQSFEVILRNCVLSRDIRDVVNPIELHHRIGRYCRHNGRM